MDRFDETRDHIDPHGKNHLPKGAKGKTLDLYLRPDPHALSSAHDTEWGCDAPQEQLRFAAPQAIDQLEEQLEAQKREFPDKPEERVLRSLAMYAGVHPMGEAAQHFTVHRGLNPRIIHPAVHLNLAGRSAKIRAIPPNWQDDPKVRTPIVATPTERNGKIDLWFEGRDGERRHLTSADVLAPVTPTPLVYKTGEIMVINPQMVCPLECSLCIHKHLGTREFGLANFTPEETTDYLMRDPTEDWHNLPMIKIITGAFRSYDHLISYIQDFTTAMRRATNGAFDPVLHDHQTIHLLTNLVQTAEQMGELKEAGVESLEHSLEIIDDTKRRQQMYRASKNSRTPGKGEQTFDDLVQAAQTAVDVYGPDHYAMGLVLGLDDLDTTRQGLGKLHEAGVKQLTGGIFVPNAYHEIALQQMTFSEIMRARRFASHLFTLPNIFADYHVSE